MDFAIENILIIVLIIQYCEYTNIIYRTKIKLLLIYAARSLKKVHIIVIKIGDNSK